MQMKFSARIHPLRRELALAPPTGGKVIQAYCWNGTIFHKTETDGCSTMKSRHLHNVWSLRLLLGTLKACKIFLGRSYDRFFRVFWQIFPPVGGANAREEWILALNFICISLKFFHTSIMKRSIIILYYIAIIRCCYALAATRGSWVGVTFTSNTDASKEKPFMLELLLKFTSRVHW